MFSYWKKPLFNKLQPYENTVNCKRKSRRRFFLFMRSRTPPISSEFRGVKHPNPNTPPSVRHCIKRLKIINVQNCCMFQHQDAIFREPQLVCMYLHNTLGVQWHFLGQTAASRCEGVQAFRELNSSPPSGCADGLVAPKVITKSDHFWYPEHGDG